MEENRRKINYIKEKRKKIDRCNICGEVKELTWDHVPPKTVTEAKCVNVNRLFEGIPEDNNCAAVYKKGIKYRSVCAKCNNVLLGANDSVYSDFMGEINNSIMEEQTKELAIHVNISSLCKAVLGHMLDAKNSYDSNCIIDISVRDYLMGYKSKPDCKLYYWIYPYDTIVVSRDVSIVNINNAIVPTGTISVMACSPVAFLMTDSKGYMPGLTDLVSLLTEDESESIIINVDCGTAFQPNTNILRHYLWPCNIGDDRYSVGAVLVGDYGFEDSRFATRRSH